ncbi:MAG: (2Fe-2S)-binding protein [Thermotogae bacterium]|nr:(2Fe-2S)-binding protein [Thermotogaceae bacterium]RKX37835.1 MAG: (2Fe-2S)-binding protein [Thermotogota bacterium]
MRIAFNLNGKNYHRDVSEEKRLLDFLREDMNMTSVKEGCGEGECGACTVIIDGKAVNSCLILAVEIDGHSVLTLEGLKNDIIQQAFIDSGAIQCGFCTPGMIMSTKALLDSVKNPTEEQIKTALEGNICRCTGYIKIIDAVKEAAKKYRGE